jgi:hypothetical protein
LIVFFFFFLVCVFSGDFFFLVQATFKHNAQALHGTPLMAGHAFRAVASYIRQKPNVTDFEMDQIDKLLLERLADLIWHAEDEGEPPERWFKDKDVNMAKIGTTMVVIQGILELSEIMHLRRGKPFHNKLPELIESVTRFFLKQARAKPLRSGSGFFLLFGLNLVSHNLVHVPIFASLDPPVVSLLDKSGLVNVRLTTALGTRMAEPHRVEVIHVIATSGKVALMIAQEFQPDPSGQSFEIDILEVLFCLFFSYLL